MNTEEGTATDPQELWIMIEDEKEIIAAKLPAWSDYDRGFDDGMAYAVELIQRQTGTR